MRDHPLIKTLMSLIEKDDSKVLRLTFGTRKVEPGEEIPKGEAQGVPTLSWSAPAEQKLIVISLDIDAPFPSFTALSPVLHWLQPAIALCAGVGPPPISSPHRCILLLYEQPARFDLKLFTKANGYGNNGIMDRMRWDLSNFEQQAKLGPAVAASYFFSN